MAKARKPRKKEAELSSWFKAMLEEYSWELDNYGQVVIYTGVFQHKNGKFYDEEEGA